MCFRDRRFSGDLCVIHPFWCRVGAPLILLIIAVNLANANPFNLD